MPDARWILLGLLALIVGQRLSELRLARRNEGRARERGAVESGRAHYPLFFVLHSAWLIAWPLEAWIAGPSLARVWPVAVTAFVGAEALRYWAILSLGPRWNTRILVVPGDRPLAVGPYRFLRHPNYVAVAVELLAVPALFGALWTALVFGLLNAALLVFLRIPAEERALASAGDRVGATDS